MSLIVLNSILNTWGCPEPWQPVRAEVQRRLKALLKAPEDCAGLCWTDSNLCTTFLNSLSNAEAVLVDVYIDTAVDCSMMSGIRQHLTFLYNQEGYRARNPALPSAGCLSDLKDFDPKAL